MRGEALLGTYYVKEHMDLANRQNADLRELFVYKLFELIRVGPKVHFIPNIHSSCFRLYIGTEEGISFTLFKFYMIHLCFSFRFSASGC